MLLLVLYQLVLDCDHVLQKHFRIVLDVQPMDKKI